MQIGAREQQREDSNKAFRKLLEEGGPDMEPFLRYFDAGGNAAQVSSAIGGEVGKEIRAKHSLTRMNEIMQGPGDFNQKLTTAASEGLVPWESVLNFMKQPSKAPAPTLEGMQNNIRQFLASNPNIPPQTRAYLESGLGPDASYETVKELNDRVIPPYQSGTLYSTRGYNIIGTDSAGREFIQRFTEPLRGGPAHPQTTYADTGEPVPPDAMKGARYIGVMPDSGAGAGEGGYGGYGGGGGFTGFGPPAAAPGAPAPSGAAPATQPPPGGGAVGGGTVPSAPSAPAASAGPQPMKFLHLEGTERKTVDNIQSLLQQLRHLQEDMQAVGPRWDRDLASRIFSKWMAQHFDYLPGTDAKAAGGYEAQKFFSSMAKDPDYQKLLKDPDLAYVMSELITTDAVASVALLASAGSRASNILDKFSGHIMEPNGNYGSIMTNIATLDAPEGVYRSSLRAMGVTRPATAPPADISPAARARARATAGSSAAGNVDKGDEDFMSKFYRH